MFGSIAAQRAEDSCGHAQEGACQEVPPESIGPEASGGRGDDHHGHDQQDPDDRGTDDHDQQPEAHEDQIEDQDRPALGRSVGRVEAQELEFFSEQENPGTDHTADDCDEFGVLSDDACGIPVDESFESCGVSRFGLLDEAQQDHTEGKKDAQDDPQRGVFFELGETAQGHDGQSTEASAQGRTGQEDQGLAALAAVGKADKESDGDARERSMADRIGDQ